MKRVLCIADLHCGNQVGIVPPEWQQNDHQKDLWSWWTRLCAKLQPISSLIVNGDLADGKGVRSGGTEQITSDRNEQCEMAFETIKVAKPKKVIATYGTPYHVGADEDWEVIAINYVADRLGIPATIGAHETVDVNGLVFDVKHKIGASNVPHGRFTPSAREALWVEHWERRGQRKKADILLRAHVHYFTYCGCPGDSWMTITLPAIQGLGTKFGARQCSGTVDQGAIWFDINDRKGYTWEYSLIPPSDNPARVIKV